MLEDVTLSVFKNHEKLLKIKKRKLELDPSLKKIAIFHPQVIYIKANFIPEEVYIFPKKGKIKIVQKKRGKILEKWIS